MVDSTPPAPCTLLYDAACGVCERLAHWVEPRLVGWEVRGARGLDAVVAVDARGVVLDSAAAVNAVLAEIFPRSRALLRLLEREPFATWEGFAYRMIARNRGHLSRLIGARACGIDPPNDVAR